MRYLCFILCAVIWVVNGEDCVDRVDFCDNIVDFKTCHLYLSKVNCRKSCNLCNEPIPQPPSNQDPSCTDIHPQCEQAFYICGQYPEMEKQCRKTCGLCGPTAGPNTTPNGNHPREERPTAAPEPEKPATEAKEEVPTTRPSDSKPPGTAVSCPNVRVQRFTPESRNVVLNKHNELRSKLAHGTVKDSSGRYLRSGKNIYELTWDCELEERAQNWADRCQYGHSTYEYRKQAGENIYRWRKSDQYDSVDTNMLRATGMWWDEIKKIDMSYNPDYRLNNYVLGMAAHWSQQSWGLTTEIGCGIANCTEGSWYSTIVVCHYFIAGNYLGKPIFELGNGCSSDSDCTTYKGSKCNSTTKLCIQQRK